MQGYSRSVTLYSDALNSAGVTQQKFNDWSQGTEAALGRLKNAFEGVWISAINSNEIQSVINGLTGITKGIETIVKAFGTLPTILGAASFAFMAFNSTIRNNASSYGILTNSLARAGDAMEIGTLKTRILQNAMYTTTIASRGAAIAFETLGTFIKGAFSFIATTALPIAGIMLLTAGIQKLVEAYQQQQAEQAAIAKQEEDLTKTYSAHADEIDKLASKYDELNQKAASDSTVKNSKEYVDTMNQLGKLMPSLVQSTDEHGNSVVKSRDAVKEELDYAKQLKDTYDHMTVANLEKNIDDQAKKIDGILSSIDEAKNKQLPQNLLGGKAVQEVDEGTKLYWQAQELTQQHNLQVAIANSAGAIQDQVKAYMNVQGITDKLSGSNQKLIDSYINQTLASKKTVLSGDEFKQFLTDTVGKATTYADELSKIPEKLRNAFSANEVMDMFKSKNKDQLEVIQSIQEEIKSGYTNWDSYKDVLMKVFNNASLVNNIISILKGSTNDSTNATKSATKSTSDYAAEVQKLTADEMKKADAEEQILGTTQNLINNSKDLITQYQILSNLDNLSAEQKQALADAIGKLSAMYPQFIENGKLNVEQMRKEAESEDILLKALHDVAEGHASAEELMTLNQANQSKNRIKLISDEIDATQKLLDAVITAAENDGGVMTGERVAAYQNATNQISQLKSEVDSLSGSYDTQIQHLANITGYQGQYYNSTTKSNNATTNSIYVTDKFKQSMDALNTAIAKQQSIMSKYPEYSSQYQNAIKEEIKLLQQQKKLTDDQANSLDKQIKSGKITDPIIVNSSSSSSGSSSSSSLSYSGKYSSYISQAASKYGVDPNLVAAIIKNESGFRATALSPVGAMGLMQLMPGTARGLGVTNAYDPYQNIMGGTKYIAGLISEFGGNLQKAIAAYNAGAGNVKKYGGIPPFAETQKYVKNVMGSYSAYSGGKGYTVSGSSSSSGSNKKNKDDAIAESNQLKQSSLDIQKQIQQAYDALITSVEAGFEHTVSGYDRTIKNSQLMMARYKEGSKSWISEVNKQISAMSGQTTATQNEINALDKLSKSESLSVLQKEQLKDKINDLKTAQLEYVNAIADADKQIRESQINAKIQETTDLYNKEIDKLQAQLDKLQNQSTNLQDEIDKTKSDKRFEYIDKNGNVVLTYDKAKVDDLEKQKKEADLQQQITDAGVKRDAAIQKLTDLQDKYTYKNYQNIADLKKIMQQFTTDLATTFKNGVISVPKHHDGRIIGTNSTSMGSFIDKLFNVGSNEQIIKGLKGEVVVNPMLPNVQSNINRMLSAMSLNPIAVPTGTNINYNMSNFTIQANNPKELFDGLDMIVRMNKS